MIILYYIFAVIVIGFAVTQLVIPLWRGEPMLPMFRKRQQLKEEIITGQEEMRNAKIERRLEKLKSEVETYKENTGEKS